MADTKKIVLGSGKLYVVDFTGEIPQDLEFETEENRIGDIQGGASLKYTPTFYTVEDDLGLVKEVFLTKEEVTLTSGILTFNLNTLKKLTATGRVSKDGGKRTIKIGGVQNFNNTKYAIRFVHTNGTKVTIVGSNTAGFEMNFAKDKETVINAEWVASALDGEGTLVLIEEPIAE